MQTQPLGKGNSQVAGTVPVTPEAGARAAASARALDEDVGLGVGDGSRCGENRRESDDGGKGKLHDGSGCVSVDLCG